ncbi:unnamed protein product [Toxocara canis]|uniref:Prepilin peptidase n=1 Tax=Toxocara canis TaxID=6265 RepID=A0A183UPN5_TOXCA|nr:unnamed protein product [Toxocara canis]
MNGWAGGDVALFLCGWVQSIAAWFGWLVACCGAAAVVAAAAFKHSHSGFFPSHKAAAACGLIWSSAQMHY